MKTTESDSTSPDLISTIATYGAPLLVTVLLIIRVAFGPWASVAFMGLLCVGVFAFYWFAFAGDDLDDAEDKTESMHNDS